MERSFAQTLSALRRERGLSQRAAAADLRISQALISHYENGAREPGLDFLRRACRYYGVSADYLLGLSENRAGGPGREALTETLAALDALRGTITQALEEST